jgi:hypothetical protein
MREVAEAVLDDVAAVLGLDLADGLDRFVVVAAAAAGVALAAGPSAVEGLSGRYTTEISSTALRGGLSGTWRLSLRGGIFTFRFTGNTAKKVILSGRYSITGGRITFKETSGACSSMKAGGCVPVMGCRGVGVYRFKRAGRALSFVRVRDPRCPYRPIVLSGQFRRTR